MTRSTEGAPLSRAPKLLYCSGHFGISLLGLFLVQWLDKFYFPGVPEETILLSSGLVILALSVIGRLTDAINDPLIGFASDRLRTRWGRRKPFMAAALLPLPLTFVLLWYPPVQEMAAANFWFLVGVVVVHFIVFTGYVAPYLALLPEIAATSKERVGLATAQGFFNLSGLIGAGIAAAVLLPRLGYQGTAWVVAGIALVFLALPLLGPGERVARAQTKPTPPLVASIRLILQNRPFVIYVTSKLLFLGGLVWGIVRLME